MPEEHCTQKCCVYAPAFTVYWFIVPHVLRFHVAFSRFMVPLISRYNYYARMYFASRSVYERCSCSLSFEFFALLQQICQKWVCVHTQTHIINEYACTRTHTTTQIYTHTHTHTHMHTHTHAHTGHTQGNQDASTRSPQNGVTLHQVCVDVFGHLLPCVNG